MSRIFLDTIDPVAAEVCAAVLHHLARFAIPLSPGVTVMLTGDTTPERAAESTGLGITTQQLTLFAKTGDLGDWGDASGALDALQELCSALYGCAGEPGTFGVGELEENTEVTTAIGLVLVASYGRAQIAMGQPVSAKAIAALAGLDPRSVRRMDGLAPIEEGAKPLMFAAEVAKQWLGARGVPGFR